MSMLHLLKDVKGLSIKALDDQIGEVRDILFDDLELVVRYFVVRTGGWLNARDVLISPTSISGALPEGGVLIADLSKTQIENSPVLESNPPVSRQYEELLHKHYEWNPYWGRPIMPGYGVYGVFELPPEPRIEWLHLTEKERAYLERLKSGDPHLQSAIEVQDYAIHAIDGDIGHVKDFLVDTDTWKIKHLIVQTGGWLSGQRVVVPTNWIKDIDWAQRDFVVNLSRNDIESSPVYKPEDFGATYESLLTTYYKGLLDKWRVSSKKKQKTSDSSNLESQSGHL